MIIIRQSKIKIMIIKEIDTRYRNIRYIRCSTKTVVTDKHRKRKGRRKEKERWCR